MRPTLPAHTAPSVPVVKKGGEVAIKGHDRIYAIGDLHGCADLFARILREIRNDVRVRGQGTTTRIILLGDLIDRGPRSRDLVAMAMRFVTSDTGVIVLRGNHEDMLLRAANGSAAAQRVWLRNGGAQTLTSFGFDPAQLSGLDTADRARAISDAIGPDTIEWFATLPTQFRSGDYFFCHAGVRPGVPLHQQSTRDLLWIGKEFARSTLDHGAVIVHGHAEARRVEFRPNRINVDTGAYRTGRLSAIGLEGAHRWTLRVEQEVS